MPGSSEEAALVHYVQGAPQPAGDLDFAIEGQGGEEMVVVAEPKAQAVKGELPSAPDGLRMHVLECTATPGGGLPVLEA